MKGITNQGLVQGFQYLAGDLVQGNELAPAVLLLIIQHKLFFHLANKGAGFIDAAQFCLYAVVAANAVATIEKSGLISPVHVAAAGAALIAGKRRGQNHSDFSQSLTEARFPASKGSSMLRFSIS